MELKKIYSVCGILILTLVTYAADNGSRPPSQPGILERGMNYIDRKLSSANDKSNHDQQEILRLQALLREKENENRRLRSELSRTQEEVKRLRDAQFALEEIARMLNVRFSTSTSIISLKRNIYEKLQNRYYLPVQRLSKEQQQAINDLLADEPGILRIIQKYHDFIKTLEGKKIIILPEN